jgi:hypothetical protein
VKYGLNTNLNMAVSASMSAIAPGALVDSQACADRDDERGNCIGSPPDVPGALG